MKTPGPFWLAIAFALAGTPLAHGAEALLPGDAGQGQALHQRQCAGCHTSMFGGDGSGIYLRADRRVRSVEGLAGQVENCASNLKLTLSKGDVNDLVSFLNQRYYKFTQK